MADASIGVINAVIEKRQEPLFAALQHNRMPKSC
jgi:hypothetical protein